VVAQDTDRGAEQHESGGAPDPAGGEPEEEDQPEHGGQRERPANELHDVAEQEDTVLDVPREQVGVIPRIGVKPAKARIERGGG
jgi:hypothetical protein